MNLNRKYVKYWVRRFIWTRCGLSPCSLSIILNIKMMRCDVMEPVCQNQLTHWISNERPTKRCTTKSMKINDNLQWSTTSKHTSTHRMARRKKNWDMNKLYYNILVFARSITINHKSKTNQFAQFWPFNSNPMAHISWL